LRAFKRMAAEFRKQLYRFYVERLQGQHCARRWKT